FASSCSRRVSTCDRPPPRWPPTCRSGRRGGVGTDEPSVVAASPPPPPTESVRRSLVGLDGCVQASGPTGGTSGGRHGVSVTPPDPVGTGTPDPLGVPVARRRALVTLGAEN